MTMRTILIMAGGTGGHIMPGLAVAAEMQARGWKVTWLGHPERMEGRLVADAGFELHALRFSGVRGKGVVTFFYLPFSLLRVCWQATRVLGKVRPDVVLGMGGYVAFPGALMAVLRRIPLVIHEQNAVAGTANRWLSRLATKTLAGFPGALSGALVVGNPLRNAVASLGSATERYAQRQGALRLLIVGGSLGAHVLNTVVPEALGLLTLEQRPEVVHQSGEQHIDSVRQQYRRVGVDADCRAFIKDMAEAFAWADLVVCRAGAMTVSEVAAAGVAALFIPLPTAIDDHQTANARYLGDCQGAWVQPQSGFNAGWLADWLAGMTRETLAEVAAHAQQHANLQASSQIADACEQAARKLA